MSIPDELLDNMDKQAADAFRLLDARIDQMQNGETQDAIYRFNIAANSMLLRAKNDAAVLDEATAFLNTLAQE